MCIQIYIHVHTQYILDRTNTKRYQNSVTDMNERIHSKFLFK